jgi:hypothetical protein
VLPRKRSARVALEASLEVERSLFGSERKCGLDPPRTVIRSVRHLARVVSSEALIEVVSPAGVVERRCTLTDQDVDVVEPRHVKPPRGSVDGMVDTTSEQESPPGCGSGLRVEEGEKARPARA